MNRKSASLLAMTLALCSLPPLHADDAQRLAETGAMALAMPKNLLAVLQEEMGKGGPAGAIAACRERAPQMAAEAAAKTGWQIRRVSLNNRNPKAVPDDWERAALQEFDRLAAAGTDPATLEKHETVVIDGKSTYRYMKALPVQPLCLTCHGSATDIPADVQATLKTLYPDDKATGYMAGQIRGAITIKRPL